MKSLILCLIALCTSTAFANNNRHVPPQASTALVALSNRVNDLIEEDADMLSRAQIKIIRASLKEIEATVLGNNVPVPPTHHHGNILVRGDLDGSELNISANDVDDLHDQCVASVKSKGLQSISKLRLSVNLSPLKVFQGYLRGANQICNKVMQEVAVNGYTYRGYLTIFSGDLDGSQFIIKAKNLFDATIQCEEIVKSKGLTSISKVSVAVNHGPMTVSQGYLRGRVEICQKVVGTH